MEYGLPGTLKNVRDAARRSDIGEKLQDSRNNAMMQMLGDAIGRRGKYEERYTPGQAWMRALTNFPIEPVGELSAAGANRAIAAKRGALQSQRKSVLNSPLSPTQKEDSLRAINDELEEIMRRQSRRDMAVQSGR